MLRRFILNDNLRLYNAHDLIRLVMTFVASFIEKEHLDVDMYVYLPSFPLLKWIPKDYTELFRIEEERIKKRRTVC